VGRDQIQAFSPSLAHYISHLHLALPAHYPYNVDTAGHLGLIYVATVVFVAGAVVALTGLLGRRTAG
jgi:hypothetical protein